MVTTLAFYRGVVILRQSPMKVISSLLLLLCLLSGGSQAAEKTARHPSIVIFLADDSGWGDYSISGNTNLHTPNIDSIARSGALLDRFYVCAVCSPTRGSSAACASTWVPCRRHGGHACRPHWIPQSSLSRH